MVCVLALLWLGASACHTLRVKTERVVKDSLVIRDSVVVKVVNTKADSTVKVTKDTAVGIAGGSVAVNIKAGDLDTGLVRVRKGSLHLRANKNTDGSLDIECTADSLTVVVRDLESMLIYRSRQYDSLVKTAAVFHHNKSDVTEREKERERSVSFAKWFCWLLVLVVGVICVYIILKNRK